MYYGPGKGVHNSCNLEPFPGPKIYDGRSVGNIVTYVYAKFRNFPLRINKALGIFRKG